MIEEKGRTCFDVPVFIGIILGRDCRGRGKMPLQKFFYQRTVLSLGTEVKRGQIKRNWLRVGYRGLCILRTGSNQCSPSF